MKKNFLLLGVLLIVNFSFSQVVITCPGNQTLIKQGFDPLFFYTVTAYDFYGTIAPTLVEGLPSGSAFPLGTTKVTWKAEGLCGALEGQLCTQTCTFFVTVLASGSGQEHLYYYDADGDGHGGPGLQYIIMSSSPTPPFGYATDQSDCNDSDPNVWRSVNLYIDNDGDGYTNGLNASNPVCIGNVVPPGYAITSRGQDCDDSNPVVFQLTTYYKDNDGDGYSDGSIQVCQGIAIIPPPGYAFSTNGPDCDDNDKNVHATITCYPDADKDGFGDPLHPMSVCALLPPLGFVTDNSDCDDNNPLIRPTTQWVLDADGDGYYTGDPITGCNSPGPGYAVLLIIGPTYSKLPGDCDDSDPNIHSMVTYYLDSDNDGYGDPAHSISVCSQTPPAHYVSNNLDCNDGDGTITPNTQWYLDADNDGYIISYGVLLPPPLPVIQCESPGPGYRHSGLIGYGDCNDADEAINPATTWYKDADNDGYSDGTTKTQCDQPAGYKLASNLKATSGDCNDADATINPTTQWYLDADHDGYIASQGALLPLLIIQCESPGAGYRRFGLIGYGDCNDADASINPSTTWYKDADNDGYSDGTTKVQCDQPTGYKLGKTLKATSGDCDDNNAVINPATLWYKDADNDGYSNGNTLTQCARPIGYKLASELTRISGDCNDNNFAVNPGVAEICGNKIDDNCNGVIDEVVCAACQTGTNLNASSITTSSVRLNWTRVVLPQQWQIRYKKTSPGSPWITVSVDGNLNFLDLSSLSSNQPYNWQIRAYCGKSWTDFSVAAAFTTMPGSFTSANKSGISEKEIIPGLQLLVRPNPTSTNFTVTVKGTGQKVPITIVVVDMYGRMVEEKMLPNDQTISLGNNYRPGVYIVRVIQETQSNEIKLVKLPN